MSACAAWLLKKEACSFGEDGFAQLHPVPAPWFPQQNRGQLRARGTWTRKSLRLKNSCLRRVIFQADQFPEFVHHTAAQTAVETGTGTWTGISTQMGGTGQVGTMARRRSASARTAPSSVIRSHLLPLTSKWLRWSPGFPSEKRRCQADFYLLFYYFCRHLDLSRCIVSLRFLQMCRVRVWK